MAEGVRLILASASPARLRTLRAAGLAPEVVVSGIDEALQTADPVADMVAELARRKAEAVSDRMRRHRRPTVIIGCDSMLEFNGRGYGKPETADAAVERWQMMSGRSGVLRTGHHVILREADRTVARTAVAATTVHFAQLSTAEIQAYVRTGEPLEVAGAFTIDGLGGAYVVGIEGDHHNVVGISLPLLRSVLGALGLQWPSMWVGR
ncbi:MAG TPA: Maf family protein [Propionibacteriaceae bacterium]|jgi:septum formation protein|nr:Maf family protein [Propionibacteriaceae bacterium]